ncbi:pseudouridine synthase [Brevundimonas sp. 2R-24]|uniref:Pseudouridine synthase n=1 Tax=Peiella sedimenti TaxID=3061083 RepID=A0ABT8SJV0_9CAUL|nr:pseudouridine synthase [Caulobacteraceae bacterium XZ-24]
MARHPADTAPTKRPGQDRRPKKAEEPVKKERIAKVMARAGVASRREVERLIGLGKVAVNGRIIDTPATLVARTDKVTVDGKAVGQAEATRLWRYHKPVGLVTTHKDPQERPTVFEHLPRGLPRVISVGRLDVNTEGLLLLTNDGELSRALELPSTGWIRRYRARARGRVTQAKLDTLKNGVEIDGVRYGPVEATLDKAKESEGGKSPANLWITVSVAEGKYREVRKVLESLGLTVNRLIRLSYGPFALGDLAAGEVEEVGARVVIEQLGDLIAPENHPDPDAIPAAPLSQGGRRGGGPEKKRIPASALSDPSKKPSKVRARAAARAEAEKAEADRPRAPARKPGWAKPGPRPSGDRPKRPFRPRDESGGEDRPRRPFKPRDEAGGDRPKRPFKPRDEAGGDRPKRSFKPRDEAGGDRPKRAFKPRDEAGGDRPKRAFKPRDESGGDRPKRAFGGKPGGPRPFKGGPGKPRSTGGGRPGPKGPRKPPGGAR